MKTSVLDSITVSGNAVRARRAPGRELLDHERFAELLRQERGRAERSGRHFVLMLISGVRIEPDSERIHLLEEIAGALGDSMRGTDCVGWYRPEAIIGVILTELGKAEIPTALDAVRQRVHLSLQEAIARRTVTRESIELSFHIYPETSDQFDGGRVFDRTLYPDLRSDDKTAKIGSATKRLVDIIGSLLAIVMVSPVLLGIAIAIRLTSAGPIFFRQKRAGQYGVPFTMYKFRSMHAKAEACIHEEYVKQFIAGQVSPDGSGGVYKLRGDTRVTPLGRILRRSSMDELPQLFNVLKGEMSLIGPRPPIFYEVSAYDEWHRRRLLEAKPGITGLWQVSGRSRTQFDDMVRLDLRYAAAQSFWLDMQILAMTPRAVLSGDGAY